MSLFSDRFKGWMANLFLNVAGNAFYQMLAGGTLLALIAAIGSRFAHLPDVWINRTEGALGICLFIVFGIFLISSVRFFQRGRTSHFAAFGAVESALQQMLPSHVVIQHADVVNIIQRGPNDYDASVHLHTVTITLRATTVATVASIATQVIRPEPPLESEKGHEIAALKAQLSSLAAREYPSLSHPKINELSEALLALPRIVVGRDNRHIDIRREELSDCMELADGIARAFRAADWRMMDEPKKPNTANPLPPGIWIAAPLNDPRAPLIADLLGQVLGPDYGPIGTKIEGSMDFGFPNFLDKFVVVRVAIGRKARSTR